MRSLTIWGTSWENMVKLSIGEFVFKKKKHKLVQFLGDGLWQWVKISSPWNVRSFCLGFPKFA